MGWVWTRPGDWCGGHGQIKEVDLRYGAHSHHTGRTRVVGE